MNITLIYIYIYIYTYICRGIGGVAEGPARPRLLHGHPSKPLGQSSPPKGDPKMGIRKKRSLESDVKIG